MIKLPVLSESQSLHVAAHDLNFSPHLWAFDVMSRQIGRSVSPEIPLRELEPHELPHPPPFETKEAKP